MAHSGGVEVVEPQQLSRDDYVCVTKGVKDCGSSHLTRSAVCSFSGVLYILAGKSEKIEKLVKLGLSARQNPLLLQVLLMVSSLDPVAELLVG